jgi:CubicO group peptidase (beta-lactamase class C family)
MIRAARGGLWISIFLVFFLVSYGCSDGRSGPRLPVLHEDFFDSLFIGFSPRYNYTEGETRVLAHIARVSPSGMRSWQRSMGVTDSLNTRLINQSSVFRVGSITKVFTATMILQLWEEGLVDLDAPFNDYLGLDEATHKTIPEFAGVTVRHLLSHRSGIPRISSTSFFDVYGYEAPVTQSERMRFLFTEGEPEFAPGSQYAYRNSNFNILGLIIEKVTGTSYENVLRDRICSPLGLPQTSVLGQGISPNDYRMARGYFQGFDGTRFHGSHAWAAGGIVSDVYDLTLFMEALVSGRLFQDPSTFTAMVSPVAGSHYGLGMFIRETPIGASYGHGGGIFGYYAELEYLPELQTVVAATFTFSGVDFIVTNWWEDFYIPALQEVRESLD